MDIEREITAKIKAAEEKYNYLRLNEKQREARIVLARVAAFREVLEMIRLKTQEND